MFSGRRVSVIGNGYCWLISFLVSFGAIEEPNALTRNDVDLINELVSMLKKFLEAELSAQRKWATLIDKPMLGTVRELPSLGYARSSGRAEFLARCV